MRSISHLFPATLAALMLSGPGMAQTTAGAAQDAAAQAPARQVAPSPQEIAARAAAGQPLTIHAPDGTTRVVGSAAAASAVSSGTTIAVPATARINTVTPGVVEVAADSGYTAEVYPDTYYLDLPYYDSPTVVEYESLIRAGGPPRYSVTTLHTSRGPYYYSRPYYARPYSYHHDRYTLHRQDRHHRPYSSRLVGSGPYSSYDPLGGALHRDAMLRFHRASYPRNLDGRHTNPRVDHSRVERDRDRGRRDADRDRGRSDRDRGRVERGGNDRPRTGYRRDSGRDSGGRDSGRSSRGGASRSPK